MTNDEILINRAPVLTLWAAVVAERMGFDRAAALSLGKTLAGLNAQSKGRHLGIYKPSEGIEGEAGKKRKLGEEFWIELMGRSIPAKHTERGVRAVDKDKPVEPQGVERYLAEKFGEVLADVRKAMASLAESFEPEELAGKAFSFYERFRPAIPDGVRGWGAKGVLDLKRIVSLAKKT